MFFDWVLIQDYICDIFSQRIIEGTSKRNFHQTQTPTPTQTQTQTQTPTPTPTQTPTNVPGFIPEDSQPTGEIIANVVDQPPTECTDENTIMVSEGTKCSDYSTDFYTGETDQNTCNNAIIYDEQFDAYYGCQAKSTYFGITCTDIEEPIAMKNGDDLESTSPMPKGYSCIHDTIDNQYLIV
jgi:Predicted solute binding protein